MEKIVKKCCKCLKSKESTLFNKSKAGKQGLQHYCRECEKEFQSKWRLTNPQEVWRRELKYRFGITPEDYYTLLTKQKNSCAICHKMETGKDPRKNKIKRLAVDHNHINGQIRGLLCQKCNTALGKFDDNPAILYSAIMYLSAENGVPMNKENP